MPPLTTGSSVTRATLSSANVTRPPAVRNFRWRFSAGKNRQPSSHVFSVSAASSTPPLMISVSTSNGIASMQVETSCGTFAKRIQLVAEPHSKPGSRPASQRAYVRKPPLKPMVCGSTPMPASSAYPDVEVPGAEELVDGKLTPISSSRTSRIVGSCRLSAPRTFGTMSTSARQTSVAPGTYSRRSIRRLRKPSRSQPKSAVPSSIPQLLLSSSRRIESRTKTIVNSSAQARLPSPSTLNTVGARRSVPRVSVRKSAASMPPIVPNVSNDLADDVSGLKPLVGSQ